MGKEKVADVTNKEYVRKLLPRKSIRATPSSVIPDAPKFENKEDGLAQAEIAVEKQAKQKSTKK